MSRSAPSPEPAGRIALVGLLACAALIGCGAAPSPPPPAPSPGALAYALAVDGGAPGRLDLRLSITGGAAALIADEPSAIVSLDREDPGGPVPIFPVAGRFPIACAASCRVHYVVDLAAAAARSHDAFEVAVRSGDDLLAPASTWLLRPAPLPPAVPVTVQVSLTGGARFLSGLRRGADAATITLRGSELPAAGYSAFGSFRAQTIAAHGGHLDLALLGGPRALSDERLTAWVARLALALDGVFERFPLDRAAIFVVPEPGSARVEFGRTLPSGGGSILLVLGERADEAALADDWILAHELVHLGTPSFVGEGRWLDEGLAVYYEPVIRRRAGLIAGARLWSDLREVTVRGLPGPGDPGLLHSAEHDRIHGGGATFVLAADLAIRARTGGARSLDDGLRAVLAQGGDATQVWSVAHFLAVIDEVTGVPVMRDLLAGSADPRPCAFPAGDLVPSPWPTCVPARAADLDQLFAWLGVTRDARGELGLHDDAPLAQLRRQIEGAGGEAGSRAPRR